MKSLTSQKMGHCFLTLMGIIFLCNPVFANHLNDDYNKLRAADQLSDILFLETFDFHPDSLPLHWETIGTAYPWQIKSTSNAGGTAPELQLHWTPSLKGTSILKSKSIAVEPGLKLRLSLKQYLYDFHLNEGESASIEISYDQGQSWITLWQQELNNDIAANTYAFTIDIPQHTQQMQIGFRFTGNNYNIWNWFIDDIQLENLSGHHTELSQTQELVPDSVEQTAEEPKELPAEIQEIFRQAIEKAKEEQAQQEQAREQQAREEEVQQQEQQRVQQTPPRQTFDGIEITEFIFNETITKLGSDFYYYFFQEWQNPSSVEGLSIYVNERPMPGMGTLVMVKVDDQLVFQSMLRPNVQQIKQAATAAVERTRNYFMNYEQIQQQLDGDDFKGSGIF